MNLNSSRAPREMLVPLILEGMGGGGEISFFRDAQPALFKVESSA